MNFSTYNKDNFVVKTSTFAGKNGNGEIHAIVTTCDPSMTFDMQLEAVAEGVNELINGNAGYVPVFVRLLLSDAANQSVAAVERFKKITGNAAIAYIEQPPLHGSAPRRRRRRKIPTPRRSSSCCGRNGKSG